MQKINGWTALVVAAGIAGVCALAYLKADPAFLAVYAGVFITLAGGLSKLFEGNNKQ